MEQNIDTIKHWLGSGSINIFGHPFAGKDTQGKILADVLGGELIAGGEILRSYNDQTVLKSILASGKLIPTEMYLDIVLPYLSLQKFKDKPLILSSVGRMHGEEETIVQAAKESLHPIKAVIMLRLSNDDVWQRFEALQKQDDRGERDDDHRLVIKTRLEEFQNKTIPVIEFYRKKKLLIEIDGRLSREAVSSEIIEQLTKRANT